MRTKKLPIVLFLKELMRRRRLLPSQLARDMGISHATVSRWLSGKDAPSMKSCRKLAEYSGVAIGNVLSAAGHIPKTVEKDPADLPELREYVSQKYPKELDEDIIVMIESLIERRRARKNLGKDT